MAKLTLLLSMFAIFSVQAFELEVMSYNVENLFDVDHDESKNDWEYLTSTYPGKEEACKTQNDKQKYIDKCLRSNWTSKRLQIKLNNLTHAIKDSRSKLPDILGLIEVENEKVVSMLAGKLGYSKFVMTNSPDHRGIDVALMFNLKDGIEYIDMKEHVLEGEYFESKPTRNILEVNFLVEEKYPLTIVVNHWPSQSNPSELRVIAAKKVKEILDSKASESSQARVISMGDFNVTPKDNPHSFSQVTMAGENKMLDAREVYMASKKVSQKDLYALSYGTYFYPWEMVWNSLDRFFLSKSLVADNGLVFEETSFEIHKSPLMIKNFVYDKKGDAHYGSVITGVPHRSNHATDNHHAAGYSDHFPIVMKLKVIESAPVQQQKL